MTSELNDIFRDIAGEVSGDLPPDRDPLRGITVRVTSSNLAKLDALCSASGMKRQHVLKHLVEQGLDEAVSGFVDGASKSVVQDFFSNLERLYYEYDLDPNDYEFEENR